MGKHAKTFMEHIVDNATCQNIKDSFDPILSYDEVVTQKNLGGNVLWKLSQMVKCHYNLKEMIDTNFL